MQSEKQSTMNEQSKQKQSILQQLNRLNGDDYASTPIPKHDRLSTVVPMMAWTGFAMFMPTYLVGAQLGIGSGNLGRGLIMIIVGTLFLAVYLSLHGIVGIKTGYSFSMLCAYSFGRKLAFIPAFDFGDVGWPVVIVGLFAWDIGPSIGVDPRALALGIGVLMLTATYVGLKGAFWVNMIQFIIMLAVGVLGIILSFRGYSGTFGQLLIAPSDNSFTFAAGVTAVVGLFANGTSRGADLIRWCKNSRGGWAVGLFAFGVGAMFCCISGALIAAVTGNTAIYDVLIMLGIPAGAVLIYFCLSWTTTDCSGYAASMGFAAIPKLVADKEVPRRKVSVIVIICIVCLSALGLHNFLNTWLTLMGTFLPTLGGIVFADFYIMSKTKYHWLKKNVYYEHKAHDPEVKNWNWCALIALVGGGALGGVATANDFLIPPLVTIIATALIYCLACVIYTSVRNRKVAA